MPCFYGLRKLSLCCKRSIFSVLTHSKFGVLLRCRVELVFGVTISLATATGNLVGEGGNVHVELKAPLPTSCEQP